MAEGLISPSVLRRSILTMAKKGESVHIACAFSIVEILSVLFSKVIRYKGSYPTDPNRDFCVLSKGHGAMALYACFAELGWLAPEHLERYFSDGSLLHGLADSQVPGIEITGGSLGHGLPIAVGMAYGIQRKGGAQHVYCIVGDGELNEGTMWESLLFAGHHCLSNLTVIVDLNRFQALGETRDILDLEPLADKFVSFKFDVETCNGHDVSALAKAFETRSASQPRVVIAQTKKGYGVSFMNDSNSWHYQRLTDDQFKGAMSEL